MGGISDYVKEVEKESESPFEINPSGMGAEWGERPKISPSESKELVSFPKEKPAGPTALDFIFENLRRTNYASANTFDQIYNNLNLLNEESKKGLGIPGLLDAIKDQDWNLAEKAWQGFTREETKTFSDLAEKAGIPAPKAAGFVGDVVLDPLTWVPASWFKTIYKTVIPSKTMQVIEKTPIGKAFSPGAGLPKDYYSSKLFAKYSLSSTEKEILSNIYNLGKGLGKRQREALTKLKSLEYDPVAMAKEIDGLVDEGIIEVKDIYKLNRISDEFQRLGENAVQEGLIKPEAFERWRYGYFPGMIKGRSQLGSPDVIPGFFEKTRKPGFSKEKHFRDIDELDDHIKNVLGVKDGAERDILKLLAYRDVIQARHLAKKHFVDKTLMDFGQKVPHDIKNIPEGMGLYLPKGALRIYGQEFLDPKWIKKLEGMADKLKDLRLKSEKVSTTTTKTESTLAGGASASSGPREQMERIVREALMTRGFTKGEASAYVHILSTKGSNGVDDVIKTVTEKTDTVRTMLDSMPVEESLIDLQKLASLQTSTMGAVTRNVPAYLLPKEIAQDLNKMNRFFIGDESTNWFLKHVIDKPIGMWKSMATSMRLPFHLRNMSSNWFLMWEGEVSPQKLAYRISQAGSIQSGLVKDMEIAGTKINKKMLDELGILGGHGWIGEQTSARFAEELDSILKYGRAKYLNPLKYPNDFGRFVEGNARIGLFIDQVAKGKTPKEASLWVKKYLFNYDELTPFEKNVMKRVMPFYTWIRKNLSLQIEMLATKPGKFATAAKGLDALTGSETPREKQLRPEYFDDMGYRKVPDFLNLKSETGSSIYFHLDMPYNDLREYSADVFKTMGGIYGMTTPAKVALELLANYKMFPRPGPLERFKDQRVPAPSYIVPFSEELGKVPMGKQILGTMGIEPILDKSTGRKILGMNVKWKYAIETVFPVFSEMGKMYPQPVAIEEENATWRKWSYRLGVKLIPLNLRMQEQFKEIDRMNKVDEFMKFLRGVGRSPTSQEMDKFMKEINK